MVSRTCTSLTYLSLSHPLTTQHRFKQSASALAEDVSRSFWAVVLLLTITMLLRLSSRSLVIVQNLIFFPPTFASSRGGRKSGGDTIMGAPACVVSPSGQILITFLLGIPMTVKKMFSRTRTVTPPSPIKRRKHRYMSGYSRRCPVEPVCP